MHIPLGRVEPYFTLGAGYASLGGVHSDFGAVGIDGLNIRGSAGLDFYLSDELSVGASLSGDLLFLNRKGDRKPRVETTDPNARYTDWVYAFDGSGIGSGGTFSLVLGVHF